MNGTIFDIKEFSIHDGSGARTTVFLKGCPLHCLWCHNPEGLNAKTQLMVKHNLCTKCGRCFMSCSHEECKPFKRCVHACPNGCLSLSGQKMKACDLAKKLNENKDLFERLSGGVTVSGGEPLMQCEFVQELADCLGDTHKAIQTSGFAEPEIYQKTILKFDYILQDIKLVDDTLHKKYTGVSNRCILENIEFLKTSGKSFVFRVPLIPNITDTEENLTAIAKIAEAFPVELLPYNPMAGAKYEMLGLQYGLHEHENREIDFTKYFHNAVVR